MYIYISRERLSQCWGFDKAESPTPSTLQKFEEAGTHGDRAVLASCHARGGQASFWEP